MNIVPTHKIEGFRGINNVQDPDKLRPDRETGTTFLVKADNTDITDDFRAARRSGSEAVYTGSSSVHSMFANSNICLFVEGTTLNSIDGNYSVSVIISGLTVNRRMNYVDIGGVIYYTNGVDKGYIIDNTVHSYVLPVNDFKMQMPAGHLIEYYNGRLYVAVGNVLYASDPYVLMQYDRRTGMIPFKDRITAVKCVDDALWIGTAKNIICLLGGSPTDFQFLNKSDFGAIENSAILTTSENIGMEINGKVVIMTSKNGLCVCAGGGLFRCVTGDYYNVTEDVQNSSAFFNVSGDKHQYLLFNEMYTVGATGRISTDFPFPDSAINDNPITLPALIVNFTGTFQ